MIDIAGRRVKFAPGRGKSQSVNICTIDGREGVYDWVLIVNGPRIQSEADLAAFRGDSIEKFVTWVCERYDATKRQYPVVTTITAAGRAASPAVLSSGASQSSAAGDGIFAGVDDFIDRSLGIEGVGAAPHHKHKTSALRLSRVPVAGLDPATFVRQLPCVST